MFKKIFATVAVALGLGQPVGAAEVDLTLSHWVPAKHPLQPLGMEPWAKSISEASGGRIEITIYPSSQLGAAPDHYDMARDGVADITFVNAGYQPGRFPIIAAGEIPFLLGNAGGGSRALNEWYRQYADKEMGDTYFCMALSHDPGTLHGVSGPLQVPADFKGKKIRPANATMGRFVSSLGAASVQVSAGEIRELMANGGADITASPWNSLFTFGLQDIVKHHLDIPFYGSTFVFVMNKAKIDGLSAEDRKVIDDHCSAEWAEKMAAGWASTEAAGRQKLIDAGHTFYKPTPEETALWKESTKALQNEWATAAAAKGIDADAAWQSLNDTLKKHGANVE